jgi:putative SOS response-associated peptidase YedK
MCGRFTQRMTWAELVRLYRATEPWIGPAPKSERRYNIAPTQDVAAVRLVDGKRQLATLRWGLIPIWSKSAKIGYSTINARADTVATKPAFRSAFKKRRCLVPADGYYEWETVGKSKLPWLYEVADGPFAFAGIWEAWYGPDKNYDQPPLESCSLIVTDASALAAKVHERMPVILDPVDYDAWLDPESEPERLQSLLVPYDGRLTARPVSTYVNDARHEGPQCIAPRAD